MNAGRRFLIPVIWLVLTGLALLQILNRNLWETDISAFLPRAQTLQEQVLMAQVQQGNSSRLWLLGLHSGDMDAQPGLIQTSNALAEMLAASPVFKEVRNSAVVADEASRELLFRYRYLYQSADFSAGALNRALQERLLDLAMPTAAFSEDLIASDPLNLFIQHLEKLESSLPAARLPQMDGVWFNSAGDTALLFATTVAGSMDMQAQAEAFAEIQAALQTIRQGLPAGFDIQLRLAGAPMIALQTSEQTRSASIRLSYWASGLIILLILLAYRSPLAVVMNALPPLLGIIFATALSGLIFPTIHVLTLAFGITLLGVALDYPVHIFSHRRGDEALEETLSRVWPVLRIGVITTVLAFAALTMTRFDGIIRLGVFSMLGLTVAALASRYLLPAISRLPGLRLNTVVNGLGWLQRLEFPRCRYCSWLLFVLLVLGLGLLAPQLRWSDDVGGLSPVSETLLIQQRQMRQQYQLAEDPTQIIVYASSLDAVLEKERQLRPLLEAARSAGQLQSWEMAASLLPPVTLQRQLQQQLPDRQRLQQQLQEALSGLPFKSDAFSEFIDAVAHSKTLPPLELMSFRQSPFYAWLQSLLIEFKPSRNGPAGYAGIIRLTGLAAADGLQAGLDASGLQQVWLLNNRQEVSRALQRFRLSLIQVLLLASVVIMLVLAWLLKDFKRWLRVLLAVAAAITAAAGLTQLISGSLNLLHLIALILVAGIGIDYAVFFTRPVGAIGYQQNRAATLHALIVCVLSSASVFFLLAISGIKVLAAIGIVVSTGVVFSFCFSLLVGLSKAEAVEESPQLNGDKNHD